MHKNFDIQSHLRHNRRVYYLKQRLAMRFPLRFFPTKPTFPFMRHHRQVLIFSMVTMLVTTALLATRGLNLGIDFAGGIVIEIHTEQAIDLADLRSHLANKNIKDAALQDLGTANDVMIRLPVASENNAKSSAENAGQSAQVSAMKTLLIEHFGPNTEFRKIDYVGPKVGKELATSGMIATCLAFFGIMLYLWFRFEWQYGVGALIALVHDAWITLGFFSATGLEFNLTSVAAILTIVGYSVNDSVVIYDRVRENARKFKKMPLDELLNLSLNETLSRTILTVGTTVMSLLALVGFGGDALFSFSASCLFGVVVGTYSSIYISAPLLRYVRPISR
jgi:preprotein translocase subunit SecF